MRSLLLHIAVLMVLVGCQTYSSNTVQYPRNAPPEPVVRYTAPLTEDAVPNTKELAEQLEDEGVLVVHLGEQHMLILPADDIFHGSSPRIRQGAYAELDLVADYLRSFNKIDVKVIGYTDNQGAPRRNRALSRQRAMSVIDFLWQKQLDVRLLSAIGRADADPIANNEDEDGRAHNRRIEIRFQEAVV